MLLEVAIVFAHKPHKQSGAGCRFRFPSDIDTLATLAVNTFGGGEGRRNSPGDAPDYVMSPGTACAEGACCGRTV